MTLENTWNPIESCAGRKIIERYHLPGLIPTNLGLASSLVYPDPAENLCYSRNYCHLTSATLVSSGGLIPKGYTGCQTFWAADTLKYPASENTAVVRELTTAVFSEARYFWRNAYRSKVWLRQALFNLADQLICVLAILLRGTWKTIESIFFPTLKRRI